MMMTNGGPPTADGDGDELATSEIRIALVLNGGVSLAVWMSGVVLELHHLALASQNLGEWHPYRQVLRDVLRATARTDVIAGTSAGGLNGAFLALGQVKRHDLSLMRDLWVSNGGLDRLLRPAAEKNPPSVLRGDDYFLVCIQEALRAVANNENNVGARTGRPAFRRWSCTSPAPCGPAAQAPSPTTWESPSPSATMTRSSPSRVRPRPR